MSDESTTPFLRRRSTVAGLVLALILGLLWYNRGPALPVQAAQVRRAPLLVEVSTNGKVDRSRPLCPYPQIAAYTGRGSIDEAANFECRAPAEKR